MVKIGVIGNGFVGKATQLLNGPGIEQIVFDTLADKCIPIGTTMNDIDNCDLIFVCVPTPMKPDGSCDTSILDLVISKLTNPFIIIRSTIPLDYSRSKNVYFMPEFLTEANWPIDFKTCDRWIVGLANGQNSEQRERFKNLYRELIKNAKANGAIDYENIYFTNTNSAEMVKLLANCYLSTKVVFFNEIYDLCKETNSNYEEITNLLKLDKRIGDSHMTVPGFNGKRGYGGTCFPKDTNNLNTICNKNGVHSSLLEANLFKNEYFYRTDKDWLSDYGRTNSKSNKPIVLVTGGAGFIGYHLCKKLLTEGNTVIVLDNLSSGSMKNVNELCEFANHIGCSKDFYFKKQDVQDKIFLPKVDQIYHLACQASPPRYQKDPIDTIKTGVLGMINVLDLAVLNKAKLLFTSTSEVYGDPECSPQEEKYWGNVNPIGIRSCYDESKRIGETLVVEYRKNHNLDTKIVRIFNTYGPNMDIDDGRVVTNFIKCVIDQKPIQIYGDGTQTRSFCYVDDMIEGLLAMMKSDESGPINLGQPEAEVSINKLGQVLEKMLDKSLEKVYKPLPLDDPKQRRPNINLALEKLQWTPKISLETGLEKTYRYFLSDIN